MNRKYVGVILLAVVLLGGVGAIYAGVGPLAGSDSDDETEEFPTGTEYNSDGDSDVPPFSFTVDEIEECGQTCRDVTATLTNDRNETASEVTVYIRIFAGENSTDPDDLVWEGTEEVGILEAGGTHTTTERIDLSLWDARKVEQNDGWITVLTTIESDEETITFSDSERVT